MAKATATTWTTPSERLIDQRRRWRCSGVVIAAVSMRGSFSDFPDSAVLKRD